MEAGGIEPNKSESKGLTTIGQRESLTGQAESQAGHPYRVAPSERPLDESNSGQAGANSGEKWNVSGASVEAGALDRIAAAWPSLRPELKAAILAIVESVNISNTPQEASREGPNSAVRS